jgi:spermidine/putrescine transport system ATP-binding protein
MDHSLEPPMLEVANIVHRYGSLVALDNVSLTAKRGEFLTILGESGSGKTTMLRVISGLERPSSVGRLAINGEDVENKPPAQRRCTTVFQNYALFPHMSVEENVGYGLKVRGMAREDIRAEARRALGVVRLDDKADRRISQLSGGEKQRVALARAFVTRPAILLLDEPLGALDERLRVDMQTELVDIQRSLDMTFIYITHSQEEALTMSDRIVLMRRGRIEQSGRPPDLFDRPVSRFVAGFMGYENILPGTVNEVTGDSAAVSLASGIVVRGMCTAKTPLRPGDAACVAVRAERCAPATGRTGTDPSVNTVPCTPMQQVYRGKYVDQSVETSAGTIRMRRWDRLAANEHFNAVEWRADDCVVLPS